MELKYVLILICVCFLSSTCIVAKFIPSDECHVYQPTAPKPIQSGRIRIFELDVNPYPVRPGAEITFKFNAIRFGVPLSTANSIQNPRVHFKLIWKAPVPQAGQAVIGDNVLPSQITDVYRRFCDHTDPKCPIYPQTQFSASFSLQIPYDARQELLRDLWLEIEIKNNRDQLLACYGAYISNANL